MRANGAGSAAAGADVGGSQPEWMATGFVAVISNAPLSNAPLSSAGYMGRLPGALPQVRAAHHRQGRIEDEHDRPYFQPGATIAFFR
ncbi:hypothetical protein Xaut_0993 [Xanthobacter versatilis]|uniref:Uncharacterized protein n=1 Tax=Xanthobacter autotrophicus (strain ATCC BAA-1158 / Py2) TaxID=78245 RepID=A7IE01_XANP2|nr:hypothetical protein Xaut_0993 [Xanthobacter autotrophicus Py2]